MVEALIFAAPFALLVVYLITVGVVKDRRAQRAQQLTERLVSRETCSSVRVLPPKRKLDLSDL